MELTTELIQLAGIILGILAAVGGAAHALLTKRDPRAAAAWVTLCLLFPIFGLLAYLALGNNRISTRARRLKDNNHTQVPAWLEEAVEKQALGGVREPYRNIDRLSAAVSGWSLLPGNIVEPLRNGDEAYPQMLAAIESATSRVWLASYIFEPGGIGKQFIAALHGAAERGVDVRVLIDGIGELYSLTAVSRRLRRAGVKVERFLPPKLLPPNLSINLRNHRKLLVCDDNCAFTGGMNIRNKCVTADGESEPAVLDLHFRLSGPIVTQIEEVFAADWAFCTRESLPRTEMTIESAQTPQEVPESACRVVVDGPDRKIERLIWLLLGSIAAARSSICIMTPYFVPSRALTIALQIAQLRGVHVTIILPQHNNLRFMSWVA